MTLIINQPVWQNRLCDITVTTMLSAKIVPSPSSPGPVDKSNNADHDMLTQPATQKPNSSGEAATMSLAIDSSHNSGHHLKEEATQKLSSNGGKAEVPFRIGYSHFSWLFYIMGQQGVKRMVTSDFFMSGLGGVEVEEAKKVIFEGVKTASLLFSAMQFISIA